MDAEEHTRQKRNTHNLCMAIFERRMMYSYITSSCRCPSDLRWRSVIIHGHFYPRKTETRGLQHGRKCLHSTCVMPAISRSPRGASCNSVQLASFCACEFPPRFDNSFTMSMCPLYEARCNGVQSRHCLAFTSAPWSRCHVQRTPSSFIRIDTVIM